MEKRKTGPVPKLPQVNALGIFICGLGLFLGFAALLITLLARKIGPVTDIFLATCFAYLSIMTIPGVWLMYLSENPATFFTFHWNSKFIRLFYAWIACILFAVFGLLDAWRPEFAWILIFLFFLSFICLAIIGYYRNYYRKKGMLPRME
jgi:hypothetical protein